MVHIPPGSSLLTWQDYSCWLLHISESTSLNRKRGWGYLWTVLCRHSCPTLSPWRTADSAGFTTFHRSQCHHTPVRSPDRQPSLKISKWTVATLQRAVKVRGIPFHREDNKPKLFSTVMSACRGHSVNTSRCRWYRDADTFYAPWHQHLRVIYQQSHQASSHQSQQPAPPGVLSTSAPAISRAFFHSHQLASPGDLSTGILAPHTILPPHLQQLVHAGASGPRMSAPPTAQPHQLRQLILMKHLAPGWQWPLMCMHGGWLDLTQVTITLVVLLTAPKWHLINLT